MSQTPINQKITCNKRLISTKSEELRKKIKLESLDDDIDDDEKNHVVKVEINQQIEETLSPIKHSIIDRKVSENRKKFNKTQKSTTKNEQNSSIPTPESSESSNEIKKSLMTISNSIFGSKVKSNSVSNSAKLIDTNNTNEFELIKVFDTRNEYNQFISLNFYYTSTTNSERIRCCSVECKGDIHDMIRIYRTCNCKKDSCSFKLRIYICSIKNKVFVYQKSRHQGPLVGVKKTRGIDPMVKEKINDYLKLEPDIIPSVVHKNLLSQLNLPPLLIPNLRQVTFFTIK